MRISDSGGHPDSARTRSENGWVAENADPPPVLDRCSPENLSAAVNAKPTRNALSMTSIDSIKLD
jgi:hypothetical protein